MYGKKTVSMDVRDVPEAMKSGYTGRKAVSIVITDEVHISGTNWSGGSVDKYRVIRLNDGTSSAQIGGSNMPAPWNNPIEGKTFKIPEGFCVQCRTMFCGKDLGITVYVRPDNISRDMLPGEVELNVLEKVCLAATVGLKSFARYDEAARTYEAITGGSLNKDMWDEVKKGLTARGLMRKNGAITPDGKNAIGDARLDHMRWDSRA